MKFHLVSATILTCLGLCLVGCSSDDSWQSPVAGDQTSMAAESVRGTGSFTVEAKYTYFRSYPTGGAIYLIRLIPGPDFAGDVSVSVSADRMLNAELTVQELSAETNITELTLAPTRQVPYGFDTVMVTISNQDHQESIQFELDVWDSGILSMNHAVDSREQFIDWLEVEHPELGSFADEQWDVYYTYPGIKIVEYYTSLSDNWEFRTNYHAASWGTDIFTKMWLRPRGEWDAVVAAWRHWDDSVQEWVIEEIPVTDYPIYLGY